MAPPRPLTSATIRVALGLGSGSGGEQEYRGVSTDSRTVSPGDLFVALVGERTDAADFLAQAAERGALGAVVTRGREDDSLSLECFSVADPLDALLSLAAGVRRSTAARVVAITGSTGKTTVKEMVACALGETHRVYRTEGNLNSQVGLPLTILRAPADADVWVLEVGASEPGEIARLTAVATPDDVVITTVGAAHLEFFADQAGVLREKLELVRGADPAGALVVGEEPAQLAEAARALRADAIVAGIGAHASYRPDTYTVGADRVEFTKDGSVARVAAGGEHHLRDALIATAIARALGTPFDAAARGLATYRPAGMRGVIREIGGLTVLADCYNANPDSLRAAIAQCRDLFPERRRTAFVGSMLELGASERAAHEEIGGELVDAGFGLIAATGAFADVAFEGRGGTASREKTSRTARILRAADPADVWTTFADALQGDELVLVKGSRGARLERVLDVLELRFGGAT